MFIVHADVLVYTVYNNKYWPKEFLAQHEFVVLSWSSKILQKHDKEKKFGFLETTQLNKFKIMMILTLNINVLSRGMFSF